MKGTCYSGIAHMPEHPDADMHGLIRVAIRDRSQQAVILKLEKAGIAFKGLWSAAIWKESKSHAEMVSTEWHYGELLACPLVLQYMSPENYRPIPSSLLRRKQQTASKPAAPAQSGVPPKDF